ncbi:hypothetical protein F5B19DRAFT_150740 [Rostrohypoxylon terebratum]|nr:hypothetical protein F5B19DRAFT_150740 [Rostrohypoxylon terebratum]
MDRTISERKSRKKRARLSCTECRKKKMSCDRNLPCQRCIKSGRPTQCSFEAVAEQSHLPSPSSRQQEQQIHDLQAEVTELKILLSKAGLIRGDDGAAEASHVIDIDPVESDPLSLDNGKPPEKGIPDDNIHDAGESGIEGGNQQDLPVSQSGRVGEDASHVDSRSLDPTKRSPRGYYSRHALFQFFSEIPELFPFIREIAEECLNPLGVNITKEKLSRGIQDTNLLSPHNISLERFLPPKEDVDILVSLYLDGLGQLHRAFHIPTFRRDYNNFWTTQQTHHPVMATLILAIISISSSCATTGQSNQYAEATSVAIKYRSIPTQWVSLCEEWLRQQSPKHGRPAYYQVSYLIYLAKRMIVIDKKKWWKETGSLIQDAIIDGLHRDAPANYTPYMREMKRRIWAALRELDLQNSYEYGLPSLLHNIDCDVAPPTNVNDDDFNETSEQIPEPKPLSGYTLTSYQVHSARSWSLRLEISRRLFSTELSKNLTYDDVLRYTHEITQAIESIPSWDEKDLTGICDPGIPTLTRAYLVFQLKTTILALHRPYIQKNDRRCWLSETVCYHTSRDILLLNTKLADLGLQSLAMLREDLFLASLNLVRVAMLQPKGDIANVVVADDRSMIDVLQKCVPLVEDMHLRCCYSELWCFITVYAAIMLLEIHLGTKSRQAAKSSCARRFLDLNNKQMERQKMSLPVHQYLTPSGPADCAGANNSEEIIPDALDFPASDWLDYNYSELEFGFLDFDAIMGNTWSV